MEITTGQECKLEHWNPKTGRLTGTKEDTKRSNAYLDNLQAMVYRAHKDLAQTGSPITAESIRNKFQGKDTATQIELISMKICMRLKFSSPCIHYKVKSSFNRRF